MANTYTQLYIHYIIAVQNRNCLINTNWKEELYKYMTGIIENNKHKLYIINGMPDHVHVFVSMSPDQSPSDLMYHVKRSSSLWINKGKLSTGKFSWKEGFGAFSYGKSQAHDVVRYIKNQELHHKKKSFIEEYHEFLQLFEIDYDERYIFKPV